VTRNIPVLLDVWQSGPPSKEEFTTIGNWKQDGRGVQYRGETYYWSKHREFLKFVELPRNIAQPIELGTSLKGPSTSEARTGEVVRATRVDAHAYVVLKEKGWRLTTHRSLPEIPGATVITSEDPAENSPSLAA